jgi:hypothetical protein
MPVKIFFCYAHEDEALLNRLKAHLSPLQREGLIDLWHDRDISAGEEWQPKIDENLNTAHIILLLVSPDFMASDYCYSKEMRRALERRKAGQAHVIPVILRPVEWEKTPIGDLQALPTDGKPIIMWRPRDKAFQIVAQGVRFIVDDLITSINSNPYPFHEFIDGEDIREEEQENQKDRILNIDIEPEHYGKSAARGMYNLVQMWPEGYDFSLARGEGRIDSAISFFAIWGQKHATVFDKQFRQVRQEVWGEQFEQIEQELLQHMIEAELAIQPLLEHEGTSPVLAPYNAAPDTCQVYLQGGMARVRYTDTNNLGKTTNRVLAEVAAGSNMFGRMYFRPKAQQAYAFALLEIGTESQEQLVSRFAIARVIVAMGSVYLASYAMDPRINPGEHPMARTQLVNLPHHLRAVNSHYQRLSTTLASGKSLGMS